jgi:hypothetical protein
MIAIINTKTLAMLSAMFLFDVIVNAYIKMVSQTYLFVLYMFIAIGALLPIIYNTVKNKHKLLLRGRLYEQ